MVTSPLPTSAVANVSFAVPVPSTGCVHGVASGGAAVGPGEGHSVEVPPLLPATLAFRNSTRAMLFPGAPGTCALSVIAGPLSGTHMHVFAPPPLPQAAPAPSAEAPAVAVMLVAVAVGTAR